MMRLGLPLIGLLVTALPAQAAPEPYFIVLPGVEGVSPCSRGIITGLKQAYPNSCYEIFDWTTGHVCMMLYHARALNRNQGQACSLALHIQTLQTEQPDRPIVLVGHSGGGAIAVMALEQLPAGCKVQQAILLAPYIGARYPLGTSLDRTVSGIDVFTSPMDFVVLGAATVAVGSLDHVHLPAAGMVGFSVPRNSDENTQFLYATKLHQHNYDPAWIRTGHYGGHFTVTLPEFVGRYVSPIVH